MLTNLDGHDLSLKNIEYKILLIYLSCKLLQLEDVRKVVSYSVSLK